MSIQKVHVKRGDTVVVISGKEKDKKGEIVAVMPKENRVVVKGINLVTKHVKPNVANRQGGMVHKEAALHASNVMLYCNKCSKATRIQHKILADGSKTRVCKHCGETF